MYKTLNGNVPRYLQEIFTLRVSLYELRDFENKLFVPKPRTDYILSAPSATVEQCCGIACHPNFIQHSL